MPILDATISDAASGSNLDNVGIKCASVSCCDRILRRRTMWPDFSKLFDEKKIVKHFTTVFFFFYYSEDKEIQRD